MFLKCAMRTDVSRVRSMMFSGGRTAAIGLLLAGFAVTAASAGTCLEQAREIAREHGLTIDPPNAASSGVGSEISAQELQQSGGVIEPPKVNDPAVIEPPGGVRYGMPTMPETAKEPPSASANDPMDPEKSAMLESVLVAARSEALQGNEDDCFQHVQKAQDLIGR